MDKKVLILGFLASMVNLGCISTQYAVTFDSLPQGATLMCGNRNWGYTPKTLYYSNVGSFIDASDCSAIWSSGARKSYSNNLTIFPSGGTITTLKRPDDVPGYSQDAEFELKVKDIKLEQKRADLEERRVRAEERKAAVEERRIEVEEERLRYDTW